MAAQRVAKNGEAIDIDGCDYFANCIRISMEIVGA
jgi:hypothetical protein